MKKVKICFVLLLVFCLLSGCVYSHNYDKEGNEMNKSEIQEAVESMKEDIKEEIESMADDE
ncbi:hypothetical protein H8S37_00460 [Mediterraneibacter sp. NSJ-55]|uniref:Lipoprotein n=1 Tax=Mediterraneibacter hominis TaxID=2763054 RepID=A0A923RQI3_9FIRM|nr:hypothetical protein [Mediterraneibacter hominis]MBC5687407.1 hypothetical protein [Mediterraneibacter hominis]